MKLLSALVITTFLIACNAEEKEPKTPETDLSTVKDTPVTNCYTYASESDTISLKITQVNDSVSGTLIYKLKEKDSNTGTVKGSFKDSILLADYTFLSEGVSSVRQVAFKKEDNNLVEGYGEVFNDNGKTSFRKPDSLTFSSTLKIVKTACE